MNGRLKPISRQVVVVTGAGSGLGRAIAERAALAGAAVVLAGPDETRMRQACEAIVAAGGRAHAVVGDPSTAEGCERIGRAAAARFDRIDGWVDATGADTGLAHAAEGLGRHLRSRGGRGVLVGVARRWPAAAVAELRKARGVLNATLVELPRAPGGGLGEVAVAAAIYALAHPMGRMVVASQGRRLSALTEAKKHRGVLVGLGVLAVAGAVVWLGRDRIGQAARPRVAKAVRPLAIRAVRRRPVTAAKLAAAHPRRALDLARFLR